MEVTPTQTRGITGHGHPWDVRNDKSGSEQGWGSIWQQRVSPRKRAELRYYASTAASGEKFKSVATL
jgi:hypothetical protein